MHGPPPQVTHSDTGAESVKKTDGERWRVVVGRKIIKTPPNGITVNDSVLLLAVTKLRVKPPAIKVKVAAGLSSAGTVRAVRHNSELNLVKMGVQVTGMTRDNKGLAKLETDICWVNCLKVLDRLKQPRSCHLPLLPGREIRSK